jgi:hypothetical protein
VAFADIREHWGAGNCVVICIVMFGPGDPACQGVYAAVEDAHYERAKAAGAEIVREIEDTDYGSREYTARDLESHMWSFGTYRPEVASSGAQAVG